MRGDMTTSQGMGGKLEYRPHLIGGDGAARGGGCMSRGQEADGRGGTIGQKGGGTLRGGGYTSTDKQSCWSTRGGRASKPDVEMPEDNRWWRQRTIGAGTKQGMTKRTQQSNHRRRADHGKSDQDGE